ncbi:MAG: ribonuclease E activity regulator RraA [Gemmatimonadota bacterium]
MSSPVPFATTDLCDAHEDRLAIGSLRVLPPGWVSLGRRVRFHGPAVTLKLFEDNSLLAEAVRQPGEGRVLVVDAGASLRCAVLGGNLAATAAGNDWRGVIVCGAVRDADEIDACDLGVRALALNPRRSTKRGEGQRDVPVEILGVPVRPGEWVYVDRDGIVISEQALRG